MQHPRHGAVTSELETGGADSDQVFSPNASLAAFTSTRRIDTHSRSMGKGYKGKNPGGKGGKGGQGGFNEQPAQKWRKNQEESSSDEESGSEEEGSEPEGQTQPVVEEVNTRGRPGELPPNSSDEEDEEEESESEDDSDDELLNPHRRAPRPKEVEPVVEKSEKELEADMEKLRLVRERRAQQAAERIAKEGFDRFAPPGSANGPPLPKS